METYCYKCDCGFELVETDTTIRWQKAEEHQKVCFRNYSFWIEPEECYT